MKMTHIGLKHSARYKNMRTQMQTLCKKSNTSGLQRTFKSKITQHKNIKQQKYTESKTIHKYLSHHYVLKRSFVFIVDSDFDSVDYQDKASGFVT